MQTDDKPESAKAIQDWGIKNQSLLASYRVFSSPSLSLDRPFCIANVQLIPCSVISTSPTRIETFHQPQPRETRIRNPQSKRQPPQWSSSPAPSPSQTSSSPPPPSASSGERGGAVTCDGLFSSASTLSLEGYNDRFACVNTWPLVINGMRDPSLVKVPSPEPAPSRLSA
ncbi:hypothetical protein Cob_v001398 [Colletotrichum orbiculare MAFF 240422]|uniref:Uncharacterized protein n=1 Tax=Colletotrichum orbiculare (strain 104-T / ATCC 96160 / CBS 514.97 / LARS 414 / MAFF 240422) TaxID=1213857 RepID=A0A484G7K6_COLOR|nr:hypothetical protein Cob_v001398 [Colletotrichum orbiculare MAFF 240422]